MIQQLKRAQINTSNWDELIEASSQKTIYAYSWYLDCIGQEWEALVEQDQQGKYIAALPYQVKYKYGLKKIEQDAFTNELGVYSLPHSQPELLIKKFLKKPFISKYLFSASNNHQLAEKLSLETTYHLSLKNDYESIAKNYSTNRKRNLKKAQAEQLKLVEGDTIQNLVQLFKDNVSDKIYGIQETQYHQLEKLYYELKKRELTTIYNMVDDLEEVVSSVMIVRSFDRIIYFFAASSSKGLEKNSQTLLIDALIQKYAQSDLILDFEGGNIESLAQFYRSFGAQPIQIPVYRKMLFKK